MKLLFLTIVMLSSQSFATDHIFPKTRPPMIFWDINDWTDIIKSSLEPQREIFDFDGYVPSLGLRRTAYRTA